MTRHGFSFLEVVLALGVVALVMAALGPALLGTLRAERRAHDALQHADELAALAVLRDDLLAAPRPLDALAVPLRLEQTTTATRRGARLEFTSLAPLPLPPRLAARAPDPALATVIWEAVPSAQGRGLAWTRRRQAHLLAIAAPEPAAEVVLDNLASLSIEAFADGGFLAAYDSDSRDARLPAALRVTWAELRADGSTGAQRSVVIDLPQVALDPAVEAEGP